MQAMNDVINLVTRYEAGKDEDGFSIFEESKLENVFAAVNSVKYTEYYSALREGINATHVITVNVDDYNAAIVKVDDKKRRPTHVEYDDSTFLIVRVYQKSDTVMDLTIQEVE